MLEPKGKDRVGMSIVNNSGNLVTILNYRKAIDVDFVFEDGTIVTGTYDNFKKGQIRKPSWEIGERVKNTQGCWMTLIERHCDKNVDVMFDDGTVIKHKNFKNFKTGSIKNPMFPSVDEVGYFGIGKYVSRVDGKKTKPYIVWKNMIQRCYSEKWRVRYPTYQECSVCEEWHNFQNFAKWYEDNYIEYGTRDMQVDKDILHFGNKTYSPETCVFVDGRINKLICLTKKGSDLTLPIGMCKRKNSYVVSVGDGKESRHIFQSPSYEKAFIALKNAKENYIKQVADEYKEKYSNFPEELYEAMYKWTVIE